MPDCRTVGPSERSVVRGIAPPRLIVRVGLPTPTGRLVRAARSRRYPVLFSANAFARRYPPRHEREGSFQRFGLPDPEQLQGLDVALDSAGFVAAVRYGDYPWSVADYVELAAAYPWAWWASMDYCCEREVATDRPLRLLRMAATVALYYECRAEARLRGLSDPMPVLQGWTVSEYLQSMDWLALAEWPHLVGVGSVCRRSVHGVDGVLAIVEALDRALPPGVQLHLFGVKSEALAVLAHHPRIASTDSMAWDFAARRERPRQRTAAFRIHCMERWMHQQDAQLTTRARGAGLQTTLSALFDSALETEFEAQVLEALALQHAELILSRDLCLLDAVWSAKRDAATAITWVRQRRVSTTDLTALDELIDGLAQRVEVLRASL